jgi:hypothetical protein
MYIGEKTGSTQALVSYGGKNSEVTLALQREDSDGEAETRPLGQCCVEGLHTPHLAIQD